MIDLSHQQPLIIGGTQRIYQHPQQPDQLIKVAKAHQRQRAVRRYAVRRYGPLRGWQREISEVVAQMARTGALCDRLTMFYGFRDTTEGVGICVEKVPGIGNALAPTMLDVLRDPTTQTDMLRTLQSEVQALFDDLVTHRIDFADVRPSNVAVEAGSHRLRVVDGLGSTALIPITRFSDRAYHRQSQQGRAKLAGLIDTALAQQP